MAEERIFKVLKKIQTLGKILQIKKEKGGFSKVDATEAEEVGKTREEISPILGVEKKAIGLLSVPISTCKIGIQEDHPE